MGSSSSQLTIRHIFQRGRSTTNQFHDINISVFVGEKLLLLMVTMCTYLFPTTMNQWEFQDPKLEVLYHISGHILWGYSRKHRPKK